MIKIAICDDENDAVAVHESIVRESLRSCGIGFEITTYTHSDNLLYDIVEDGFFYDLLLLDIEMPKITGMELCNKIKPQLPQVKIIFVTSHIEYTIDAFELSIFRYIPKDDLEKRLKTALIDAAKLIELEAGQEFIIARGSYMEKLPYKDILYIRRDGKNAIIISPSSEAKVRKSLQQVYDELHSKEFIFINRGCIVNIIHIMKINKDITFLRNGAQLPISRSYLQEVKRQINQFWGEHI